MAEAAAASQCRLDPGDAGIMIGLHGDLESAKPGE